MKIDYDRLEKLVEALDAAASDDERNRLLAENRDLVIAVLLLELPGSGVRRDREENP